MEWYYLPYQVARGAFNMALDAYLANNFTSVLKRPLLRFYGWDPYCLSLGIHQKLEEVNREQCAAFNIDVVRRPTGGRAVLHSQELTYSVIVPPEYMNLHQIYEFMHIVFARALKRHGVPAELTENQPDLREFYKKKHSSLCFASAAKTEVKIGNKKLIGSAQHLFRDAILQHGSILMDEYHKKIVDLFQLEEKEKVAFTRIIESSTTEIARYNDQLTIPQFIDAILEELSKNDVEFIPFNISEEMMEEVSKLEGQFAITDNVHA
ncbi:MAG: lipoate--protein ligase family protein [Calditrichia bacterium]